MKTLLAATAALLLMSSAALAQDATLERVQNLINAGRFTDAGNTLAEWERAHANEGNASSADRARALYLRGVLTSDAEQAEGAFLGVVLSYPSAPVAPQALLRLGQGLTARGDTRRAIAYLERLRSDYPGTRERDTGLLWLARAYHAAGSSSAACTAARDAARSSDPNVRTLAQVEHERVCAAQRDTAPQTQRTDTARATPQRDSTRALPPQTSISSFAVQTAAFSARSSADATAAQLRTRGFDARVAQVEGSALFRVRVGSFTRLSDANAMAQRVRAAGFTAIVVDDVGRERQR